MRGAAPEEILKKAMAAAIRYEEQKVQTKAIDKYMWPKWFSHYNGWMLPYLVPIVWMYVTQSHSNPAMLPQVAGLMLGVYACLGIFMRLMVHLMPVD
jgi:hypothetical protein